MAVKLKLVAAPTFKAKVGIPVAGGTEVKVEFTFTHRPKAEYDAWAETLTNEGVDEVSRVMSMVTGWDLEDPFNEENVRTLLDNYLGASVAIFRVYVEQMTRARLGN